MDRETCTLLSEISDKLVSKDLSCMVFLCGDDIPAAEAETIKKPFQLFSSLEKKGKIMNTDLSYLKELFYTIQRKDILKNQLETDGTDMEKYLTTNIPHISKYRCLLYHLACNIKPSEVEKIKFVYGLQDPSLNSNSMELFSHLEKSGELAQDNLSCLKKMLDKINRRDLLSRVEKFEEQYQESNIENASEINTSQQETSKTFAYEMNRKHRGYCLIISNSDFANSPQRRGTEIDAEELTNVFTWLGFDMEAYTEQMSENIKSCMEDFSKRDHSDRDSFVCCIMSHGESGTVLGTDNLNVSISDIITYFIPKNCPTLAGKPKLFFIQACQGTTPQNAYPIEKDAAASGFKKNYVPSIPGDADLLIGMSTVDGHCSYRDVREGTWYIQALCDNLADLVPKGEDLLSILTRVNNDVSQKLEPQNNGKQIPQPVYTLRKKVVFPKPAKPYKSKGR